jgi:hypothetical protein
MAHLTRILGHLHDAYPSGIASPTTATSIFVSDASHFQPLPNNVVTHSTVPSEPNPVQETRVERQPRTTRRTAPYTRRGRAAGAYVPPYSDQETEILLNVAETRLPIGAIGWESAAEAFNFECLLQSINTTRDHESLKRKFYAVCSFPSLCRYDIVLLIQIAARGSSEANWQSGHTAGSSSCQKDSTTYP